MMFFHTSLRNIHMRSENVDESIIIQLTMTSDFESSFPFALKNYDWEGRIPIGQSSFSTVYKVKVLNSKGNEYVAVKKFVLPKTHLAYETFLAELEKLKGIKSDYIVQYIDSQIHEGGGYIVLELCECDLGAYLTKYEWKMPESVAQTLVSHIVEALSILRKRHFYSVYVNPKNFLIKKGVAKLNPIGIGKYQVDLRESSISSLPLYMAPEVILCGDLNRSENNSKAEIWSVGVIAYELAVGCLPFSYQSWDTYRTRILNEQISIEGKTSLSEKMKDFVSQCLVKQKKDRAAWQMVHGHAIVQKHSTTIPQRLSPEAKNAWKTLKKHREQSESQIAAELESEVEQLKSISLKKFREVSANHVPHIQQNQITDIFTQHDALKKEQLDSKELSHIYKLFRIEEENEYVFMKELAESIRRMNIDIYKISENFDHNNSKTMDYSEIKELITSILPNSSGAMIDKVWHHLKQAHHGVVTTSDMLQELLRYLPEQQTETKTRAEQAYDHLKKALLAQKKELRNLFAFFDQNKDDKIGFREFLSLFNSVVGFERLEEVKIVFNLVNKSKSGHITLGEMKEVVRNA